MLPQCLCLEQTPSDKMEDNQPRTIPYPQLTMLERLERAWLQMALNKQLRIIDHLSLAL
jgi:hypothetical protein